MCLKIACIYIHVHEHVCECVRVLLCRKLCQTAVTQWPTWPPPSSQLPPMSMKSSYSLNYTQVHVYTYMYMGPMYSLYMQCMFSVFMVGPRLWWVISLHCTSYHTVYIHVYIYSMTLYMCVGCRRDSNLTLTMYYFIVEGVTLILIKRQTL